ncbi:MAG: hypothetical protein ACP5KY_07540 [Thermoproteus sp.]
MSNTHRCVSGLFSPIPKERRSELFDREELAALTRHVSGGAPLVLCLGVRRIGKTSVVRIFLDERDAPHTTGPEMRCAWRGSPRRGVSGGWLRRGGDQGRRGGAGEGRGDLRRDSGVAGPLRIRRM